MPDPDGVALAVCDTLGAHDCWMADSPMPRYGESDAHVTPALLDTRLAKGAAVPLVSTPDTAWRLKAGTPEIWRANAEAPHALNTRDESGRTTYPGVAGRGMEKSVRWTSEATGIPVVASAENTASWSVVAAVAGTDRDTARVSCVIDWSPAPQTPGAGKANATAYLTEAFIAVTLPVPSRTVALAPAVPSKITEPM